RFFYVNPLLSRGEVELVGRGVPQRQPWFHVACCPPNVMRLLASLEQYIATYDDTGIQLHHYMPSHVESEQVALRVDTDYPWSGEVDVHIQRASDDDDDWTLQFRQPAWCQTAQLRVNGERVDRDVNARGYLEL